MEPQYRHTQFGWVVIVTVVAVTAFVLSRVPGAGMGGFVPVAGVALLLFGTLTVEIADRQLRVWFGLGLIRKRIPLASVASFKPVRNPWYSGWGIRLGPWGVLWNVSGFDAVELALVSGERFRIGTDEPEALVGALTRAGSTLAVSPASGVEPPSVRPVGALAAAWRWPLAVALGSLVFVGGLFWTQMRPPTVRVTAAGLEIRSLAYRARLASADVKSVTLEPALPRILARTNGFAGAGSLRGHFRLEGLGDGLLFVEQGHPPYLQLTLDHGFVIVNFREAEKTRALFDELARAWPDRTAPDAPRSSP